MTQHIIVKSPRQQRIEVNPVTSTTLVVKTQSRHVSVVGSGQVGPPGIQGVPGPTGPQGIQGIPGTDPWTYVVLQADEISTSTSNVNTGLRFTPIAGRLYEVEVTLFARSVATTTGVRPGINWPDSNVDQNVALIEMGNSGTSMVFRVFGNLDTANASTNGVVVANEGIYGHITASFVTSGTPSSDFVVTIATEIAGSEVRFAENSWLKYRVIA